MTHINVCAATSGQRHPSARIGTTSRFVLITGCSGGGKSTLLDALQSIGHTTVSEPGRRVIAAGGPLPWEDMAAFGRATGALAQQDLVQMRETTGWVFFDRGIIDATVAVAHATTAPLHLPGPRTYHRTVFLAPPWPEIYRTDAERQHGFEAAIAEYDRLLTAIPQLGYDTVLLPKTSPADRASFVLDKLR